MLQGFMDLDGGSSAFPFVALFYGTPSGYLWEDSCGRTHTIVQGEDSEEGDATMPLLFSLGQHSALVAVQAQMADGEVLLAFHDDIYTATMPNGLARFIHYNCGTESVRTLADGSR